MIETSVLVVKIENHHVFVENDQQSACGGCQQRTSCATHALGGALKSKAVQVACDLPLEVGDHIMVAIDESRLLRAAFLCYLMPLIGLFMGAGLADRLLAASLHYRELAVVGSATLGLLLSLHLINTAQNRLASGTRPSTTGLIVIRKAVVKKP